MPWMNVRTPVCYIRMFQVFGIQCSLQWIRLNMAARLFQDALKCFPSHGASGWIVLCGSSCRPLGHLWNIHRMGSLGDTGC